MQAIEIVFVSILFIIGAVITAFIGFKSGTKKGHGLKNTEHYIYRNYPTYKSLKMAKIPDDEIASKLLFEGSEKQFNELAAWYFKYEAIRAEKEVKHFKEQFKDKPLGEKIMESQPFKY